MPIVDMHRAIRSDYGDLVRIPGFMGRADTLISFKPSIFEKLYRTEGIFPRRRGMETFIYYRKKVRPEIFEGTGGLLTEQGQKWFDIRSKVNPVMLQPRVIKMYIDQIDQVAIEFLDACKTMRNPTTLEMPSNFGHELNCWALESIGVITLDERLGVLHNSRHVQAQTIINVKAFLS